jgi:hypothetical protein
LPTATATPTSTPTATPTATPTPIPTIQVGSLSVPDPRATNPELFDLRNPDAPIPQFVNAMKMAGIELLPEEVITGIQLDANNQSTYVYARTSNTGNEFADGVCLLMAQKLPDGNWKWDEAKPGIYWRSFDKYIGIYMNGDATKVQSFSALAMNYFGRGGILALSGQVRPGPDIEERRPTNSAAVRSFRMARDGEMGLFFHYVAEPGKYPNYVTAANVDQWLGNRLSEIATVTKQYKSRFPIFLVYNEPWNPDTIWWNEEREPLRDKYGERYLEVFIYQALKTFLDNGFIPNNDFVIVVNDDTSPARPDKAEQIHQVLISARDKAFEQLWDDQHYQQQSAEMGLKASKDLQLVLGLQSPSPENAMLLVSIFSDVDIFLTEVEVFGDDDFYKANLMKGYINLMKSASNVKGLLIFNPFTTDDPLYPQVKLFDDYNKPTLLYYQLLR